MNVAILRCLIEESSKTLDVISLQVVYLAEDEWSAEIINPVIDRVIRDPLKRDQLLAESGRTPAEAVSRLETLCQRWY